MIRGRLARLFERFLKNQHRRDVWILVAVSATSKCQGLIPRPFRVFFRHMPVRYHTFAYATKQFTSFDKLAGAMRRDLVNFLFDNLAQLQAYDAVKVYYDNG